MRGRDLLLALMIVAGGVIITAAHRGVFSHWSHTATNLADLCLPYAGGWPRGEDWRKVEHFIREIDAKRITALIVDNPNGQTIVTNGRQDQFQIEVYRYGRGKSFEDAFPRAQRPELSVDRSGSTVKVAVTGPEGFWRNSRLDMHLTVPASLSLKVKAVSGLVEVQRMRGSVDATTASGRLRVTGARQVNATTASGDLDISHVSESVAARSVTGQLSVRQVSGDVQVSTASSRVTLEAISGALHTDTISGGIAVRGYAGREATINTTSGRVTASLSNPLLGRFFARSMSGSILVTLPPDSDCVVDLASRFGHVGSDLPLYQAKHARGRLRGRLGVGRGRLVLISTSGAIAANRL
jgi:hypothetical protein